MKFCGLTCLLLCRTPPSGAPRTTHSSLRQPGGPGCASTFGSFYELGPFLVDGDGAGGVSANPHAWSGPFGLLLVDQPVGSGYSVAAREEDVPTDEMAMAHDLYKALQVTLFHYFDDLRVMFE